MWLVAIAVVLRASIAVAIVALGAAAYCLLSGAVSAPGYSPLSVDQPAAWGEAVY
jgi:hypothetical protein